MIRGGTAAVSVEAPVIIAAEDWNASWKLHRLVERV